MASPAMLGSRALRASRISRQTAAPSSRGIAAAASSSFQYETGDASGVRFASRDVPGATTTLAVVARGGTRFQPYPGYSDALEKFAFKSTTKRSALRITREVELLGGEVHATHNRESLVLQAKFLKEDLPYFAELFAEVISKTRYTTHELKEEVEHILNLARQKLLATPHDLALNSVHAVAFHRGLGSPINITSSVPISKYIDAQGVADWSDAAYARSNIAVVANGAVHSELSKWVKEFYGETGTGSSTVKVQGNPSKYHGGEERIAHSAANTMILGFPGSPSFFTGGGYKPEYAVLAALLGGETSIKWAPGFSLLSKAAAPYPGAHVTTNNANYSDAGLLYITFTGKASDIRSAAQATVDTIKKIASGDVGAEDLKKATMLAKFKALETGQLIQTGLEGTGMGLITGGKPHQVDELGSTIEKVGSDKVKAAAKALLDSKASVSTVGDLYVLPYADEIGLKV